MFFYRSILLPVWGRIHRFFLCPGTFLRKEKKVETLGLGGEDAQSKNKDNAKGRNQRKPVSVCAEVKGGQWGWKAQGGREADQRAGLPPAELSQDSSASTWWHPRGAGGSSGGGLGWAGRSLVLTAWQTPLLYPCPRRWWLRGRSAVASSPPLPSSHLQNSGCALGGGVR